MYYAVMKKNILIVILLGALVYTYFSRGREPVKSQVETTPAPTSVPVITDTPVPTPSTAPQQFSPGGGGGGSPQPTPTPVSLSPFNYMPLPVDRGGPENDIVASSPLTASRTSAQVDDFISFSTQLKNVAPYRKTLQSVCFESSDGNFGCVWYVHLDPGQTFDFNNVGSWVTGGDKNVWVTWSQDGFNYYRPKGGNMVTVHIIG